MGTANLYIESFLIFFYKRGNIIMAIENREIKSSVFADLFGDDELDGKKNFLSIYNAIHETDLKLEERILC